MTSQHAVPKTRRPLVFKIVSWVLLAAISLTAFSDDADAKRRRHKKKKTKRAAIINEPKLYERMGGSKAVAEIVDEWMRLSFVDTRIAALYAETTAKPDRIAKLRKGLNDQICELADGPCAAKPVDPKKALEGMTSKDDQFLALAENLFKSMQKFNVPEREKNELLGRLGDYRAEVEPEDEGEEPQG